MESRGGDLATSGLSHRSRLETCLEGELPDRTPVAMWRHFPVDDQSPANLAAATVEFQRIYDFDLVKVTPASSFCIKDWGVEDEWRGSIEGTREYTKRVILEPEDWNELPVLDPRRNFLAGQLECLQIIVRELGEGTPVIQTIFNPLSQAKYLAGEDRLLDHLRHYPDALHAGLKTITESTQSFIEAALQTGIAGIFFAVQHAQYGSLSWDEYEIFGRQYDLQALEPAKGLWLNILHLHGINVMFDQLSDYPVAVINWHDRETPPNLAEAKERFSGALLGGLRRWETMVLGDPEQVASEGWNAMLEAKGRRFILGTGCVVPIITPRANLLAARKIVEQA